MRKVLQEDTKLSKTEQTGNSGKKRLYEEVLEVSVDARNGRMGSFLVEREFSEGSAVEVLERIVGRLLEIWEERREVEECMGKVLKGRMAE